MAAPLLNRDPVGMWYHPPGVGTQASIIYEHMLFAECQRPDETPAPGEAYWVIYLEPCSDSCAGPCEFRGRRFAFAFQHRHGNRFIRHAVLEFDPETGEWVEQASERVDPHMYPMADDSHEAAAGVVSHYFSAAGWVRMAERA